MAKSGTFSRMMSSYAENSCQVAGDDYSPQTKPLNSLKLSKPDGEDFDGNSIYTVRDKTADTHIEPYFLERAEQELYEQVKDLKPYQREKKLERIASLWLKELR